MVYRHRASESSRYSHGMRVAVASEYRLQPEVKEGLQARKQTFFRTNRAMRTGLKPLHNFRLKAVLRPRGKRFYLQIIGQVESVELPDSIDSIEAPGILFTPDVPWSPQSPRCIEERMGWRTSRRGYYFAKAT